MPKSQKKNSATLPVFSLLLTGHAESDIAIPAINQGKMADPRHRGHLWSTTPVQRILCKKTKNIRGEMLYAQAES
jgi:hypothetical protein